MAERQCDSAMFSQSCEKNPPIWDVSLKRKRIRCWHALNRVKAPQGEAPAELESSARYRLSRNLAVPFWPLPDFQKNPANLLVAHLVLPLHGWCRSAQLAAGGIDFAAFALANLDG